MISWTITDRRYSRYDLPRLKAAEYSLSPLDFLEVICDAGDLGYLEETSYIHAFYCEFINGMKI